MPKKKKNKFPYKYLRPEELEELEGQSNDELLTASHKQNKEIAAYEKLKKDDHTLSDLKKRIKSHKDNHDNAEEIKKLRIEIKDLQAEINEEIVEEIQDKKDLEGGHNDNIKASKEKLKAITNILSKRNI